MTSNREPASGSCCDQQSALPSSFLLIGWIFYLIFCTYVVRTTDSAGSLDHAAIAARAYREGMASTVAEALGKIFSPWDR